MDEPIKVIHKYKNRNRKIQYNVLIFVGNLLSDSTNKVLKKIKDKNLYDTLTELNDRDIEIMKKEYGPKWYKYFFIDKHINYTFDKIIKPNESKKKEIIKKYGKDWYDQHIDTYSEISKTVYSFQTIFKQEKEQKIKEQKIKANEKDTDLLSYKVDSITNNKKINDLDDDLDENELIGGKLIETNSIKSKISDEEFVRNINNRLLLENSVKQINLLNKVQIGGSESSSGYEYATEYGTNTESETNIKLDFKKN